MATTATAVNGHLHRHRQVTEGAEVYAPVEISHADTSRRNNVALNGTIGAN